MKPIERVKKVIQLEKPDKVPVCPQVNEHSAKVLGVPYGDIFNDPEIACKALLKCYDVYKGVDMSFGGGFGILYLSPLPDAHSSWFFKWKLPQRGEDEIPQMLEHQILSDEHYMLLKEKGLLYFIQPHHPKLSQFLSAVLNMEKMKPAFQRAKELGLFTYARSIINIPTDLLANFRGLNSYLLDFYDRPESIKELCDWMVDDLIAIGIELARQGISSDPDDQSKTILLGANRSSASYISPRMFEEFVWQYFYKEVMAIIDAGFTPVIHLDGNWTPMAHYFRSFPRGKCLFHLDDQNDIFQWKKILGDHSALMGNVPAGILSYGSEEEVDKYCRRLIEIVGEGGGFILANACSLPYDAKIENVKAMILASEKYGIY